MPEAEAPPLVATSEGHDTFNSLPGSVTDSVPGDTTTSHHASPYRPPPPARSAAYSSQASDEGKSMVTVEMGDKMTPLPPPPGRKFTRRNTYTAEDLAKIAVVRNQENPMKRRLRLMFGVFVLPLLMGLVVGLFAGVPYASVSHQWLHMLSKIPVYKLPANGEIYLVNDSISYRHDVEEWGMWVWLITLSIGACASMSVTMFILWALYSYPALHRCRHMFFAVTLVTNIYFGLLGLLYMSDMLGSTRQLWDTVMSYILAAVLIIYLLYVVDREFAGGRGFFRGGLFTISVGLVIAFLYSNILVPIVYSGLSSTGRALFRLIVHPILWEPALALSRHFARTNVHENEGNTEWLVVAIWFTVSQLWGRFLVTSESNLAVAAIISLLLAVQEVAMRLSVKKRDSLLTKCMMWGRPKEAVEVIFNDTKAKRLRLDVMLLDTSTEFYSIAVSGLAAVVYNLSDDPNNDVKVHVVLLNVLIQLVIEIVTDTAVLYIEKRHMKLDIFKAYDARCQLYHVYQGVVWFCMTAYWLNGFAGMLCWQIRPNGFYGGYSQYC